MEHHHSAHGPALAAIGIAALAAQPYLSELYQILAALALASGIATAWLNNWWKYQDRLRDARQAARNFPRICNPDRTDPIP